MINHLLASSSFFWMANNSDVPSCVLDRVNPSLNGNRSSSNKIFTQSVLASPSTPLPKRSWYEADSMALKRVSSADMWNSGLACFAAANRAFRASADVSMEMVSEMKCAAVVAQISGEKVRLSPEWMSFRLRLASCSMTWQTVSERFPLSFRGGYQEIPPCFAKSLR